MTHDPRPEAIDIEGRTVEIGTVVGRGGEGTVYEVRADPSSLAKIYHHGLPAEKADKLRIMASMRTPKITELMAWPSGMLYRPDTRQPIGTLMPRIVQKQDVHTLYSPKSRRTAFNKADWRFLVRAAANTARAFAVVHEANCVIGDVNHGGILVAQDATVSLIDCDSFQVSAQGRHFLCEVGVETFTPTELQGKVFRNIVRTPNHDNFGLAILVFLLLFMGRHPFSGRYRGTGDMPIGRAIAESRFAFGSTNSTALMDRPPGTPPLSLVGAEVSLLFERAFSETSTMSGRPTAQEWIAELARLERATAQCAAQTSHWYPNHLTSCPWCWLEQANGIRLFPFVARASPTTTVDVEDLWQRVRSMPDPGPAPALEVPDCGPSAEALAVRLPPPRRPIVRTARRAALYAVLTLIMCVILFPDGTKGLAIAAAAGMFAVAKWIAERAATKRLAAEDAVWAEARAAAEAFKTRYDDLSSRYRIVETKWAARASASDFNDKRQTVGKLYASWQELPHKQAQLMAALRDNLRQAQLDAFLDRHDIMDAMIDGVGPERVQTLASYGIETAKDAVENSLIAVPGFGPQMIGKILAWRRSIEARFTFAPNKPIDPVEVDAVRHAIYAAKTSAELQFGIAYQELLNAHSKLVASRETLLGPMKTALIAVNQAKADWEHVRTQ